MGYCNSLDDVEYAGDVFFVPYGFATPCTIIGSRLRFSQKQLIGQGFYFTPLRQYLPLMVDSVTA